MAICCGQSIFLVELCLWQTQGRVYFFVLNTKNEGENYEKENQEFNFGSLFWQA